MTGNYNKQKNISFSKVINTSGILQINTKTLLPLLILLMIAINTSMVSIGAQMADRYAVGENNDLETAFGFIFLRGYLW